MLKKPERNSDHYYRIGKYHEERLGRIWLLCTPQSHLSFCLAKRHPFTYVRAKKALSNPFEFFGNRQQRRHDHRFRPS